MQETPMNRLVRASMLTLPALFLCSLAAAQDVTCAVQAPAQIVPGQPFDVVVNRVPGYPGTWFSPTIVLKLTYPTNAGWAYRQVDTRTIPKMGPIRMEATLMAPYYLYPDPSGGFVPGGTVQVVAVVREPAGDRFVNSICTTSTIVSP
jgi:hypothetical protein